MSVATRHSRRAFTPLSLGATLWLDPAHGGYQERSGASATTPVTDGSRWGTWANRGLARGYATAASDALRPVRDSAAFISGGLFCNRAVGSYLNLPATLSLDRRNFTLAFQYAPLSTSWQPGDVMAYVTLGATDAANSSILFGLAQSSNAVPARLAVNNCGTIVGNSASFPVSTGRVRRYILVSSSSATILYEDGVAIASGGNAGSSGAFTGGMIGSRFGLATDEHADGIFGHVVAFPRALSGSDVARVDQWLQTAGNPAAIRNVVPATRPMLAFLGDSLTVGVDATLEADTYPAQVIAGLASDCRGRAVMGLRSAAFTGTGMTTQATWADVYPTAARAQNICLVWCGTNDIFAFSRTAAQCYADAVAFCEARQSAGWKVVFITPMPRGADAGLEVIRQSFLTLVLADATVNQGTNLWSGASWCDVVADLGNDATLGVAGSQDDTDYFNADKIHLNTAGFGVMKTLALAALAYLGVT